MLKLIDAVYDELEDAGINDKMNLALNKVCDCEDKFVATLSKEQKELYDAFENAKGDYYLEELEHTINITIKVVKSFSHELT